MNKPQRYVLIRGLNSTDLTKRVSAKIDEGWRPTGGVAIGRTVYGNQTFYQAMVKTDQSVIIDKNTEVTIIDVMADRSM